MPREAALAILFADVSHSTQLYDLLGDIRAREIIAGCLDVMAKATAQHGGTVIKTIGDEVMCAFPTAQQAVLAAMAMQNRLAGREVDGGHVIAIRVGLHAGTALVADNDVFGDAVNVAARMAGAAKAGQILTTGVTVAALDRAAQAPFRQIDLTRVKGKQDEIAVYELVWRTEGVTTLQIARRAPWAQQKQTSARLVLTFGEQRREVSDASPALTLGRTDQSDLFVPQALVSRQHARLEFRGGRFILTDFSTNGTYIAPDGGAVAVVHRDSLPLSKSGVIGLGEAVAPGSPYALRYEELS